MTWAPDNDCNWSVLKPRGMTTCFGLLIAPLHTVKPKRGLQHCAEWCWNCSWNRQYWRVCTESYISHHATQNWLTFVILFLGIFCTKRTWCVKTNPSSSWGLISIYQSAQVQHAGLKLDGSLEPNYDKRPIYNYGALLCHIIFSWMLHGRISVSRALNQTSSNTKGLASCERQHRHFTPPRVPQFSNSGNFCPSASYDLHSRFQNVPVCGVRKT